MEKLKIDDKGLNEHERAMAEFIGAFIKENGYPPSVRELCKGVGLKSTSSVHHYLHTLKEKGILSKLDLKTRALKLVSPEFIEEDTTDDVLSIPLVGNVAAGIPILAEQNIEEYIKLPISMLKKSAGKDTTYMLKVKGDSMINLGILNGDYVIVSRCNEAENGQIVVAMIENEVTVKTLYKEKDHVRLQPANDSYEPIIVKDVQIIGRVIALFRKM